MECVLGNTAQCTAADYASLEPQSVRPQPAAVLAHPADGGCQLEQQDDHVCGAVGEGGGRG